MLDTRLSRAPGDQLAPVQWFQEKMPAVTRVVSEPELANTLMDFLKEHAPTIDQGVTPATQEPVTASQTIDGKKEQKQLRDECNRLVKRIARLRKEQDEKPQGGDLDKHIATAWVDHKVNCRIPGETSLKNLGLEDMRKLRVSFVRELEARNDK